MKPNYTSITNLIKTPPIFFDKYGVPIFNRFSTDNLTIDFARESALVEVACVFCKKSFQVEFVTPQFCNEDAIWLLIKDDKLCYGAPPYHGCPGDHYKAIVLRVLEYWCFDMGESTWARVEDFEIDWVRECAIEGLNRLNGEIKYDTPF